MGCTVPLFLQSTLRFATLRFALNMLAVSTHLVDVLTTVECQLELTVGSSSEWHKEPVKVC